MLPGRELLHCSVLQILIGVSTSYIISWEYRYCRNTRSRNQDTRIQDPRFFSHAVFAIFGLYWCLAVVSCSQYLLLKLFFAYVSLWKILAQHGSHFTSFFCPVFFFKHCSCKIKDNFTEKERLTSFQSSQRNKN